MKERKFKLTITILLIMASAAAFAQSRNGAIGPLKVKLSDEAAVNMDGNVITLSQAIKIAIDNNNDILTGKYDVAMTDSDFRKYQKKYSPFLSLDGGIKNEKYPDAWHYDTDYGRNKQTVDVTAAISKAFETGTSVSAGYTHTYTHTKWPSGLGYPGNANIPVLFASLEQELLKNAFGYNDRREQKLLKNAAQMQKDYIIYGLSLVVVQTITDYWDVVVKKAQMDNAELMLKETRRVRNITAGNVRLGLAEKFILNYWNALVAQAEASVANSTQRYRDSKRHLFQTMNIDLGKSSLGTAVMADILPEINEEESLKKAFERRVDYLNAVRSLENAKLQHEIYSNNALPSVKASVSVLSQEYDENIGEAHAGTTSFKNPSLEARVAVTYPLNDTVQKTNRRNAAWQIKQAEINLKKYKRVVKDDIESAIENIRTNHALYQKSRKARIQAEAYYRRMVTSLRRGRYTASDVRNALDGLISGREAELQTLVVFNASLLQFEAAKNELFETYGIDVEKYIPKK